MDKLICVECEKLNGRDYELLKNNEDILFCPHCGRRTPKYLGTEAWSNLKDNG